MKNKHGIIVKSLAAISLLLLPLISCENFLKGNDLMEEIEQVIDYTLQPELEVLFAADQGAGTVYPVAKGTYKITDPFTASFEVSPDYMFIKWVVIDYLTKEEIPDVLDIESPYELKTNVKVIGTAPNVQLYPQTKIRPAVTEFSPLKTEAGVSKDSSIYITFSKDIDSQNDLSLINITADGIDVNEKFNNRSINNNIITISSDKNNLLEVTSGKTKSINVTVPKQFFYEEDQIKVQMEKDYSFSFNVNNQTNSKAEVMFGNSDYGTVIPSGVNQYDIGSTVNLIFKPVSGYKFTRWTILDSNGQIPSSNEILIKDLTNPQTTLEILSDVKSISITAECVLLPQATFTPEYSVSGVKQDSTIIITFNKSVKTEDFNETFKNIKIESNGQNLIESVPELEIEPYFYLPQLSENGKTLTIKTIKSKRILPVDGSEKFTQVKVTLSTLGLTDKDGVEFENDIIYEYRVNKNLDDGVPVLSELILYKTKNSASDYTNELTFDDLDDWESDQFIQNHVGKKIYGYVKAYDDGDGLASVVITEEPLYTTAGIVSNLKNKSNVAVSNFTECHTNDNTVKTGWYETYFEYELSIPEDGIERLYITACDFAGNPTKSKTIEIVKDTEIKNNTWRFINTSTRVGRDASFKDVYTKLYFTVMEDKWLTYNEKEYKSVFQDFKYKLFYGTKENDGTVNWVEEPIEKDGSWMWLEDYEHVDKIYSQYNKIYGDYEKVCSTLKSASIGFYCPDAEKETVFRLEVTDAVGNTNSRTLTIPAKNFWRNCYNLNERTENRIPEKIFDEKDVFTYQYDDPGAGFHSTPNLNGNENEYYYGGNGPLRTVFIDRTEGFPVSTLYSPCQGPDIPAWWDVDDYKQRHEGKNLPVLNTYKFDKVELLENNYFKYRIWVSISKDEFDSEATYYCFRTYTKDIKKVNFNKDNDLYTAYFDTNDLTIDNINPDYVALLIEKDDLFYRTNVTNEEALKIIYNNDVVAPTIIYYFSSSDTETTKMTSESSLRTAVYDEDSSDNYCNNYMPYNEDVNFSEYEYVYIPLSTDERIYDLNSIDYSKYMINKGIFATNIQYSYTWGIKYTHSLDIPLKDVKENQLYLLMGKATDVYGNSNFRDIRYIYFETSEDKYDLWSTEIWSKPGKEEFCRNIFVKNDLGDKYEKLVYSFFDTKTNVWDPNTASIYNIKHWGTEESSDEDRLNAAKEYPIETTDKYIFIRYKRTYSSQKSSYYFDKFNDYNPWFASFTDVSSSIPQYFYTGSNHYIKTADGFNAEVDKEPKIKNVISGVAGATVFCDAPCLYYVCTSAVGYGKDIDKWERYGAKLSPNQTDESCDVDLSQVQPGDYYVVIVHYADNTTKISEMLKMD